MKLTVIGSADAFNSGGRGHSCYLVQSPGAGSLMVDFGPTALRGLYNLSIPPNTIDGVVFTHLHGDHIGGFPFLFMDALYNSVRKRELSLLGPVKSRESLETVLDACYSDMSAHMASMPVRIDELEPGESRDFLGYRVHGFAADHMQLPHRPLCLRVVDAHGKSVAFSGDTRMCPGLFAAADGADLLVAECTRLAHPAGAHCTWDEWVRELPNFRAKRVVLSHLGGDVRAKLPGLGAGLGVEFAEDGVVIEV